MTRSTRNLMLASCLAISALATACPPPWAFHDRRDERHDDHRDNRNERHDDRGDNRNERHDDKHERHDDKHERHDRY
jgi:hypothetical protein